MKDDGGEKRSPRRVASGLSFAQQSGSCFPNTPNNTCDMEITLRHGVMEMIWRIDDLGFLLLLGSRAKRLYEYRWASHSRDGLHGHGTVASLLDALLDRRTRPLELSHRSSILAFLLPALLLVGQKSYYTPSASVGIYRALALALLLL